MLRTFCFSFNTLLKQDLNNILATFHFQNSVNGHLGRIYSKLASMFFWIAVHGQLKTQITLRNDRSEQATPSMPDVNFPQRHTDFHFAFSNSMAFGGHQTFRQLYMPWEKTKSTLVLICGKQEHSWGWVPSKAQHHTSHKTPAQWVCLVTFPYCFCHISGENCSSLELRSSCPRDAAHSFAEQQGNGTHRNSFY